MKSSNLKPYKVVYPVSLGCPKNKSDFEKLLYLLKKKGYLFSLNPEDADIFWVNTCAFIRPAIEESLEHIFELATLKKSHQKLIVSGCLPSRYNPEDLKKLLPEVDEFYGIEPFKYFSKREPINKICTDSSFFAYLKISEGCSHRCSYCTIPKIRGPFRSKPKALLLKEAQNLLKEGVKELILVGQDITSYGKDFGEKNGLVSLIQEISRLPYEFRIRLLYLHPAHLSSALIEDLLSIPKVLPYFDLPIQHAHPQVLRKMRRGYNPEKILKIIESIRKANPFASVRTTIIVGFPGEGEEEFAFLLDFLREAQFDYLGVFSFYPEEGTPAEKFKEKVSYKERQKRKRRILSLQREITKERLKARIGQEEEVLILGEDASGRPLGLAKIQAPEIDGISYIKSKNKSSFLPGELLKVKIVKSGRYDLWVEPLDLRG